MVNNLGPIDRVGAGGLDAVGNEFLLFKKHRPPFAFKKDTVTSAVHTFEVRPENILSVSGTTVAIGTMSALGQKQTCAVH